MSVYIELVTHFETFKTVVPVKEAGLMEKKEDEVEMGQPGPSEGSWFFSSSSRHFSRESRRRSSF